MLQKKLQKYQTYVFKQNGNKVKIFNTIFIVNNVRIKLCYSIKYNFDLLAFSNDSIAKPLVSRYPTLFYRYHFYMSSWLFLTIVSLNCSSLGFFPTIVSPNCSFCIQLAIQHYFIDSNIDRLDVN